MGLQHRKAKALKSALIRVFATVREFVLNTCQIPTTKWLLADKWQAMLEMFFYAECFYSSSLKIILHHIAQQTDVRGFPA